MVTSVIQWPWPSPQQDLLDWHSLQCSPQYSSVLHPWLSGVQQGSRKTQRSRTYTRIFQSILQRKICNQEGVTNFVQLCFWTLFPVQFYPHLHANGSLDETFTSVTCAWTVDMSSVRQKKKSVIIILYGKWHNPVMSSVLCDCQLRDEWETIHHHVFLTQCLVTSVQAEDHLFKSRHHFEHIYGWQQSGDVIQWTCLIFASVSSQFIPYLTSHHRHRKLRTSQCTEPGSQPEAWLSPLQRTILGRTWVTWVSVSPVIMFKRPFMESTYVIQQQYLPQNDMVARRLRSKGGAHLLQIPWQAGYVTP